MDFRRYFHISWRKQKTEKCHKFVFSVSNFSKTFVISTEMQRIGTKKVIHRGTREIICNTFDYYMRITFPFEALTKIGFLRICFFNLPGDQEGLFKLAIQLRKFLFITL
jgi:hypothetical protein